MAKDRNSRNKSRDVGPKISQESSQRNTLYTCARQFGGELRGTAPPMYEYMYRKSTVFLFLVRSVISKEPVVFYGHWDGVNDLYPVTGEIDVKFSLDLRILKLPKSCLNKTHIRNQVMEHYE